VGRLGQGETWGGVSQGFKHGRGRGGKKGGTTGSRGEGKGIHRNMGVPVRKRGPVQRGSHGKKEVGKAERRE